MRIGFIIYGSLDTLTGGYLYDQIVVQGLKRLGHEVEVISLPSGCYLQKLIYGFSRWPARCMLKEKFDIIIQDELCHPSLFLPNKQLLRQDTRPLLVALVHHILCDEPRHRWHNMLLAVAERSFLASVDGFICNSETTRRKVRSLVDHNRPELIAYPAGDRLGSPLSAQVIGKRAQRPGPLELFFLGNVIPRKGLLPLLRALQKVDRKVWRLTVVGGLDFDPAHTAEVRQLCSQLDLTDSVRLFSWDLSRACCSFVATSCNLSTHPAPHIPHSVRFALLEGSSHFWLTNKQIRKCYPLRSISITETSSLLQGNPPLCSASVLSSLWAVHLAFSLNIGTTGSHVPHAVDVDS